MDGILFHRIDRFHQLTACFAIKQAGKQNGLVKGWFYQNRFAFHITVLLDVMNDLLHECDLLCIQQFVVDELGKCLYGSIVVQLCHFTHQQTKGSIPKLPCIVLFAAQLTGKDMFQLGIVAPGKRNVLGQLVDDQRIAAVLHDVAVHTFPVLAEIVAGIQRFALGLFQYRVGKGRVDRFLPCQNTSYRPKNLALDYQTGLHFSESSSFLYL